VNKNFGGVIWTNHVLFRLKQRGLSQSDAWAVFRRPDQSRYAKTRGAWIFYKTYGSQKMEVVAKKNKKNEWVILSVWSKQIFTTKSKKSWWQRLFLTLKAKK